RLAPAVAHQVFEVESYRAGIAQVMILMEQPLIERQSLGPLAQFAHLQRTQLGQGDADRLAGMFDRAKPLLAHPIGGDLPARRQDNAALLFELEQQRAGSHVLKLALGIAPAPLPTQLLREPTPAPLGIEPQQLSNFLQLLRSQQPALHSDGHGLTMPQGGSGVQRKRTQFCACLPPSEPSSFFSVHRKDLNSYP